MNTIMPAFNPMPRYDGSLGHVGLVPHPGEIARIERVNKHRLELWALLHTVQQVEKAQPKIVERVTESDTGWLPPLTYTMNGKTSWSSHPLRTGLILHEVV
jgi:hypothetical protein